MKLSLCQSPAQEMTVLTDMVTWCTHMKVKYDSSVVMYADFNMHGWLLGFCPMGGNLHIKRRGALIVRFFKG